VLSYNPGIKMYDVLDNPTLPWEYEMLCQNTFDLDTAEAHSRQRIIEQTAIYKNELITYVVCYKA
jgi:hypothetical protein